MSKKIVFTTVKYAADNRVLPQDDKGYYRVTMGAINSFNSAGEFYLDDGVKELIESASSSLNRRLKSGSLKGEVDHPKFMPGMTKQQFYSRNMRIELNNTSHHIREIMLTPTDDPSGIPGRKLILVEAWIKPSGVKGEALKTDLDNPEVNVAFSIRSFTADKVVGGVNHKKIMQIITWDWVNEPGIAVATKWKKLGIESLDVFELDLDEISNEDGEVNSCFNCALESDDERVITEELISNTVSYLGTTESVVDRW